jgi:NarL family two-component system response regulator LiaR
VIRLLIGEPQAHMRRSLAVSLEEDEDLIVVGSASRGHELVDLARVTAPDVVLMDLLLPDMDGAVAIRKIVDVAPAARVVIHAAPDNSTRIAEALEAGAIDVVPTSTDPDDIAQSIRAATDGDSQRLIDTGEHWHVRRPGGERAARLSERDWDVLRLLAHGHSNKVIAHRLGLTVSTVKAHLTRIYKVLPVAGRTQAALWAQERGLDRMPTNH